MTTCRCGAVEGVLLCEKCFAERYKQHISSVKIELHPFLTIEDVKRQLENLDNGEYAYSVCVNCGVVRMKPDGDYRNVEITESCSRCREPV